MSSPDSTIASDYLTVVALGSNLPSSYGSSQATLYHAFDRLQLLVELPITRSSLWQTSPWECAAGTPDFVNAVASLRLSSKIDPHAFLAALLVIENEFGRQRSAELGDSRSLDLDLICCGDQVIKTEQLTLPHPEAHLRRFVLKPLAEIEPDLRLPGQSLTVIELERGLSAQGISPIVNLTY